ncbi:uncharacterized protein RCC_09525 [Ramularia collo-cygni]|uniref:Uncharacterized protein n=1 Tax=Ramularia collo-cygni TaxID=112498 RepID=A0A2D3VHT8_9PEZI|nr:uncharacterized protein RCC_09525 [Ramularia collo-cygni]CZT23811.1 uncharacterized protein RCC_09525 [Ramularia collo-cygni]
MSDPCPGLTVRLCERTGDGPPRKMMHTAISVDKKPTIYSVKATPGDHFGIIVKIKEDFDFGGAEGLRIGITIIDRARNAWTQQSYYVDATSKWRGFQVFHEFDESHPYAGVIEGGREFAMPPPWTKHSTNPNVINVSVQRGYLTPSLVAFPRGMTQEEYRGGKLKHPITQEQFRPSEGSIDRGIVAEYQFRNKRIAHVASPEHEVEEPQSSTARVMRSTQSNFRDAEGVSAERAEHVSNMATSIKRGDSARNAGLHATAQDFPTMKKSEGVVEVGHPRRSTRFTRKETQKILEFQHSSLASMQAAKEMSLQSKAKIEEPPREIPSHQYCETFRKVKRGSMPLKDHPTRDKSESDYPGFPPGHKFDTMDTMIASLPEEFRRDAMAAIAKDAKPSISNPTPETSDGRTSYPGFPPGHKFDTMDTMIASMPVEFHRDAMAAIGMKVEPSISDEAKALALNKIRATDIYNKMCITTKERTDKEIAPIKVQNLNDEDASKIDEHKTPTVGSEDNASNSNTGTTSSNDLAINGRSAELDDGDYVFVDEPAAAQVARGNCVCS